MDTSRRTNDDLRTRLKSCHIITNASASNACMAVDRHEVTDGNDDLLDLLSQLAGWRKDQGLAGLDIGVELLQNGDGECSSLSSTGLCLGNDIGSCVMRSAYIHPLT